MRTYFLLKDFFSLLNIGLILYLLLVNREKRDRITIEKFITVRKILCLFFVSAIRLLENRMEVHIAYIYLTVIMFILILGYAFESSNIMYNMLISSLFLLIISS